MPIALNRDFATGLDEGFDETRCLFTWHFYGLHVFALHLSVFLYSLSQTWTSGGISSYGPDPVSIIQQENITL
jgi:hypothetical protein